MKKLQKHALHPRPKEKTTTVSDEDDFVKACKKIKEWIFLTYSVYTGVLDFQYDEGQITSSQKAIRKKEYMKQRDQNLSKDCADVESFILFYYECKQNLDEAIRYAKLKTESDTSSASELG